MRTWPMPLMLDCQLSKLMQQRKDEAHFKLEGSKFAMQQEKDTEIRHQVGRQQM